MAAGGPLETIDPADIDRIETNLQIAHAPKSSVRDFRTDYLMKVFRYDAQARAFVESPMENQIDRDRILSDDRLKADFKTWLLEPKNFGALDRGTILIPDEFLAKSVIAPTPVGFVASDLQPAFGLVQGEGDQSRLHGTGCGRRAGEERRHAAEHPLGRGLRAQAQRRRLRRLSSDPRHRRLSFPGRGLDGGEAVEFHRRPGLAALLRRSGAAPRHPHGVR